VPTFIVECLACLASEIGGNKNRGWPPSCGFMQDSLAPPLRSTRHRPPSPLAAFTVAVVMHWCETDEGQGHRGTVVADRSVMGVRSKREKGAGKPKSGGRQQDKELGDWGG
jgi:hypothetical protein